MAGAEPALPKPTTSALLIARDQIVECVDTWGAAWWRGDTIGHAGKVTPEFLVKQPGMAPRAVVTVVAGNNERISGGAQTLVVAHWFIFIVTAGALRARAEDGLILTGEAFRLITDPPWLDVTDSAFAMTPEAESVKMRAMYQDKDEGSGLSVWGLSWLQAVDMGTANRAKTPAPGPLVVIAGTDTIAGEPNDDTIETEIT